MQWLMRFILKQRIGLLRADIVLASERRHYAVQTIESLDVWSDNAEKRLRSMKARLALLERPGTLLFQALQRRSDR